jgi:hypothetical protein
MLYCQRPGCSVPGTYPEDDSIGVGLEIDVELDGSRASGIATLLCL